MPFVTAYEKAFKYFHTDNYIHMAVYGDSFSLSGQKVFYLKTRNKSRLQRIYPSLNYLGNTLNLTLSALCSLMLWCNLQLNLFSPANPSLGRGVESLPEQKSEF